MENKIELIEKEIRAEFELRIIEESIPRIIKCLGLLNEEEIWLSPNKEIPSIGNLILHLNGNVRQWFLDGFCGVSFTRMRDEEFSARKTHTKSQLITFLQLLTSDLQSNTYKIKYDLLLAKKTIQEHYFVSGFTIISHITEHFSYHTGQIATLTKLMAKKDLGFYEDVEL